MDLTLVLHSRDIASIGLGDIVDPITSTNPSNSIPPHLQPATITLRIEVFANKCPLAAENLGFVANRHLMTDEDADAAVSKAKALLASTGAAAPAAAASSNTIALALRETAIHRVDKSESLEFGTSNTESIFGCTYPLENLDFGASVQGITSSTSTLADGATPATHAGFLVVSNFGGASTNGSRYFITLKPMKSIMGNHTILGRVRTTPNPNLLGGIGNGFDRLMALVRHPQFKINARTCVPNNKMSVADSVVLAAPVVASIHADPNNMGADEANNNGRKSRLAGKLRGRDDDDEAETLREDFEKGLDAANGNANPFANPTAFGGAFDMNSFGAADSRVRTTKKRRAEATLLSTAPLGLADQEKLLRTVAVSTAQHFEGHDDDKDEEEGLFASYLPKKVYAANVSQEELAATYRPVGVNPNQMAPSTFNLFEANAMTYTSDLQEVLEQQLERQHNRERRMSRKQKALEKQQQHKLGGLGGGGAETSASAALKAALAATAAAAQMEGANAHKVNKMQSSTANTNSKLARIREKYSANGQQHSVKAFQERAKAKAGQTGIRKRY